MTALALPQPGRPRTFRRFLAAADRRQRRAGGSGSAYSLIVLACFYAPAVILGAASQLTSPVSAPVWLAPAPAALLLAAVLTLASTGWSLLGPIAVPPAWGAWVLPTPLDRGALLTRRVWARVPAAALLGLAAGMVAAMAASARGLGATAFLAIGAAGGVLAYAAAVLRQSRPGTSLRPSGVLAAALVLTAAVAQTWLTATTSGTVTAPAPFPGFFWWPLAGTVMVLAAVGAVGAASWAGRIPQHRLIAAHAASRGIALAFTELSLEPVGTGPASTGLVSTGRRDSRAGVRSRPFTGTGTAALASLTWRRLWRGRVGLARFAVCAAVFYPLALVGRGAPHAPQILAVAGVIAASLAISGVAGTARHLQRSPHLAVSFGLDPRSARRTALVAPTVMALIWAVLVTPAMLLGGVAWAGPLVTVLGYAVVAYRLGRPEFTPTYAMGMQYPMDLGLRFARGPAQLVFACVVAALVTLAL